MHVIMRSLISYLIVLKEALDIVRSWVEKGTSELVVRDPTIIVDAVCSA